MPFPRRSRMNAAPNPKVPSMWRRHAENNAASPAIFLAQVPEARPKSSLPNHIRGLITILKLHHFYIQFGATDMKKSGDYMTVADFFSERLAKCGKTTAEVASQCGFESPNLLALISSGAAKVPFESIHELSHALGGDPAHLLRLALAEYLPDVWQSIERNFTTTSLSANERELVKAYRQVTGGGDSTPVVIDRNAVLAIVVA